MGFSKYEQEFISYYSYNDRAYRIYSVWWGEMQDKFSSQKLAQKEISRLQNSSLATKIDS